MKLIIIFFVITSLFANQTNRNNDLNIILNDTKIWTDFPIQPLLTINEAKLYCNNLHVDSYKNWRLPTIEELESIIDYHKEKPKIISSFKYVYYPYINNREMYGGYWSSDLIVWKTKHSINYKLEGSSYIVEFKDGSTLGSKSKNYVRCIHEN